MKYNWDLIQADLKNQKLYKKLPKKIENHHNSTKILSPSPSKYHNEGVSLHENLRNKIKSQLEGTVFDENNQIYKNIENDSPTKG